MAGPASADEGPNGSGQVYVPRHRRGVLRLIPRKPDQAEWEQVGHWVTYLIKESKTPPADRGEGLDQNRIDRLLRRTLTLREQRNDILWITNVLFGLALLVLCAAAPVAVFGSWRVGVVLGAVGVLFLIAALASRQRYWEIGDELLQVDHEFDRVKLPIQDEERRALKLFQNHSVELRRYYTQALSHSAYIFWIGVICIVAGFGIVGATIVFFDTAGNTTEKIVLGGLGAASGVMANFIGAIYIRMYSATIASFGAFHTRMVGTHHLHFANFLAAKINEPPERDRAFFEMAVALSNSLGPFGEGAPLQPAAGVLVTPANGDMRGTGPPASKPAQ